MASKTRVGLVQIGEFNWVHRQRECYRVVDGVLGRKPIGGFPLETSFVYLPYSVGLLQAYAQFGAPGRADCEFLPPIYGRLSVANAVERLTGADVVAFSAYVWNIRLSLAIAAALKARHPEVQVVFGGPQVPDDAEAFLRRHPFVDVAAHGEGERVFRTLLDATPDRAWEEVPGVSFIDGRGDFVSRPRPERLRDLSEIPSPYLTGIFDDLMLEHPEHQWMAMWETNRGCPFSCTFCDWGSAVSARVNRFDVERLDAEADWFAEHRISHVFVCDANFGILARDVHLARHLVDAYEQRGVSLALSVQNTKTATERSFEIHQILTSSKAVTFGATLSLQSVDRTTLDNVRRSNISLDVFRQRQQRFAADGVATYTDIILGMPGETYESFTTGVARIMAEGQHHRIAFYNCSVLPNAEMGDPEYRRRFGLVSVPARIVHEHDPIDATEREEMPEYLDTVVATAHMGADDWVEARVFADLVSFLHFDRVLQVPFVLMAGLGGAGYRDLIELFARAQPERHPLCAELVGILRQNARSLGRGQPGYVASAEFLNLWWPADQYLLVKLVAERQLDRFYGEAEELLCRFASEHLPDVSHDVLCEALRLNRALLRVPNEYTDAEIRLSHNVLEYYQAAVAGQPVPLERRPCAYLVDRTSTVWLSWKAWAVDVTMQTYRPEAFLYPVAPASVPDLAGSGAGR